MFSAENSSSSSWSRRNARHRQQKRLMIQNKVGVGRRIRAQRMTPSYVWVVLLALLDQQTAASRIFLPPNPPQKNQTRRFLVAASQRLPVPTEFRLHSSGSTEVAAAASAASFVTVVRRSLSKKSEGEGSRARRSDGIDGIGIIGGNRASAWRFLERVGARGVLVARLASDIAAAAVASILVSPFISIVDRSIIQSASGTMGMKSSLAQGLRVMVTKPALFSSRPDFVCTFSLYAATYLAANWITTIASETARSDTLPKFVGTTAVNMPGSIAKDQALTKLFGVVNGAARVPAASFALFTMRDVATMAAAFTLPTPMSAKIQQDFGVNSSMADGVSQLVSPGLAQLFCTPVHILGLDLYNHPKASAAARLRVVQSSFLPAMFMRVCRIGVAFGVGGLGNTAIRKCLHDAVDLNSSRSPPPRHVA